jgi:hypothetical protein
MKFLPNYKNYLGYVFMDRMTDDEMQLNWNKTIDMLLGDDNPCKECLVRARCTKSVSRDTACEELKEKLAEAIKDETKT